MKEIGQKNYLKGWNLKKDIISITYYSAFKVQEILVPFKYMQNDTGGWVPT